MHKPKDLTWSICDIDRIPDVLQSKAAAAELRGPVANDSDNLAFLQAVRQPSDEPSAGCVRRRPPPRHQINVAKSWKAKMRV